MSFALYERQGHVGLLTVNRPEALNALNSEVVAALSKQLEEIARSDVRCVVLTGSGGKAFVAGADIAEMKDINVEQAIEFSNTGNVMMEKLESLPAPVIAAVNGYALGGGCELALACDIRIASEKAVFGLPEVTLGILPGYGGVQRLARLIGLGRAKELAYTARRVQAQEAREIGLVNQVCAPEELMTRCMELAEMIAANAPLGVRSVKEVANGSVGLTLNEARRMEVKSFAHCFGTSDQRMAMQAFVEKRKAEPFQGI